MILPPVASGGKHELLDFVIVDQEGQKQLPQMPGEQKLVKFQVVPPFLVFEMNFVKQAQPCRNFAVLFECREGKGEGSEHNPCDLEPRHVWGVCKEAGMTDGKRELEETGKTN